MSVSIPILEAKSVTVAYSLSQGFLKSSNELIAVDNTSLSVHRGEVLGIVGESGCGKSTLARVLLGLARPTAGEVFLEGKALSQLSSQKRAEKIQPVFQDPYSSLNPSQTIEQIIRLPLKLHSSFNSNIQKQHVKEMMDLVGLSGRLLDAYPSQLSGGQRQRVAIARALIMRPSIIVCDEPTSALDVSVQSQILNLLQTLQCELDLTILFISHNMAVVEHIATRVCVMYLGRVVEEAETTRLFNHARHPYTQALMQSVLTPEPGLGIPDTKLGSSYPDPANKPRGCTFHPRCHVAMPLCKTDEPELVQVSDDCVACHLFSGANS